MKWFEQLSRKTRVFESTAFRPYGSAIFLLKLQSDTCAFKRRLGYTNGKTTPPCYHAATEKLSLTSPN